MRSGEFALVFLGAGLGGCARYAAALWITRPAHGFPWSTFAVNVLGSLLIGALIAASERGAPNPAWRLFLGVGVLGGFTTFSSFSGEVLGLAGSRAAGIATAYALGSVAAGLAACALGRFLGNLAFRAIA